jgi:GxxExxY protein
MTTNILFKEECYKIIGGAFEVYNEKGCGFLEPVYQECLEIEFDYLNLPAVSQAELKLSYRNKELKQKYRPDFICFNGIVVELKAVDRLTDKHRAQLLNYLNATGFRLGILINFGSHPNLEWERIVR